MKAHSVLRWSAFAVILLTIASVGIVGTDRDAVTIQHVVATGGTWSPVIFVFGYAIATVLFVPGSVFTLAGGALFRSVVGALYSALGATAGATLAFLLARFVAGDWVARKAQGSLEHFVLGVEREGWGFVAVVRLVPLIPFNLLNYVLGLTRIPIGQYIFASFICMMPGAFAYAYLGFAGREAAVGSEYVLQQATIASALLAAAIFLPRLVARLRRPSIA